MLSLSYTDRWIIKQVIGGKVDKFAILVKRYHPIVYGVAYGRLRNVADAEDVAQDVFLKAFQSLPAIRDAERFGAWLVRVTKNRCSEVLSNRARAAELPPSELVVEAPAVEQEEAKAILWEGLSRLSNDDSEVLVLYYFSGKDTRQIAEALNISVAAARKRLQRARTTLGKELERTLGDHLRPPRGERNLKHIMGALPPTLYVANASASAVVISTVSSAMSVFPLGAPGLAVFIVVVAALAGILSRNAKEAELVDHTRMQALTSSAIAVPLDVPAVESSEEDKGGELSAATKASVEAVPSLNIPAGAARVSIHGVVLDRNRHPVPKAVVTLSTQSLLLPEWHATPSQQRTTTSTQNGSFHFDDLLTGRGDRGKYYLIAQAGTEAAFGTYVFGGPLREDMPLELIMKETESIGGRVEDEAGTPVVGATVYPFSLENEEEPHLHGAMQAAVTDEQGRFQLNYLHRGSWNIVAYIAGNLPALLQTRTGSSDAVAVLVPATGEVAGRAIHKATGAPIAGVDLSISDAEAEAPFTWLGRIVRTDGEGRYHLADLPTGKYKIRPLRLEGYPWLLTDEPVLIEVVDDPVHAQDLQLVRGGGISGRVFDPETGRGIPGYQLLAMGTGNNSVQRWSLPSDEQGKYDIPGLPAGEYKLHFATDPRVQEPVNLALEEVKAGVDIEYTFPAVLAGWVRDTAGNPVAGALVHGVGENPHLPQPASTKSDGSFVFKSFKHGERVMLQAYGPTAVSEALGPIVAGTSTEEPFDLTLSLPRNGSISGQAVDATGNPVANARINIWSDELVRSSSLAGAKVDALGKFTITGLPPALYSLQVGPAEAELWTTMADDHVQLAAGESKKGVVLAMPSTGGLVIAGRVTTASGGPIEGAHVEARGDIVMDRSAQTNAAGTFEIRNLADENYYVFVYHDDYSHARQPYVRPGTMDLHFALEKTFSVSGKVVDARNGQGVTGARLLPLPGKMQISEPFSHLSSREAAITDDNGSFVLDSVPSDRTLLLVHHPDFAPTSIFLADSSGATTQSDAIVKLEQGANAVFEVTDLEGKAIKGAAVHVGSSYLGGDEAIERALVRTGEDGTAKLGGLPVGHTFFTVFAKGYSSALAQVEFARPNETKTLRVVIDRGGEVAGRVTVNGEPGSGTVSLKYFGQPDLPVLSTQVLAGGSFRFENVAPGTVQISAGISGFAGSAECRLTRVMDVSEMGIDSVSLPFYTGSARLEGYVDKGDEQQEEQVMVEYEVDGVKQRYELWSRYDGWFTFENLPAGPATLIAGMDSSYKVRVPVLLREDETLRKDVVLQPTASIEVTCVNNRGDWALRFFVLQDDPAISALNPEALGRLAQQALCESGKAKADSAFPLTADLAPGTYHLLCVSAPRWDSAGLAEADFVGQPVTVEEQEQPVNVEFVF